MAVALLDGDVQTAQLEASRIAVSVARLYRRRVGSAIVDWKRVQIVSSPERVLPYELSGPRTVQTVCLDRDATVRRTSIQ